MATRSSGVGQENERSVKTSLHQSFAFSALEKYASLALSLMMTAVIARLLTPDEIGVFVVGSALIVVAETLRDFGTSVYLIQEPEISREDVRTTFTVMFGMSVLAALLLNALAGPLVSFYAEPRLDPVIRIASVGTIFGALSGPTLALLRREMAFGSVAGVNLAGAAANAIVTLIMIVHGWGYLSLVLASVASSISIVCAALVARPEFWIFKPSLKHWRKILAFGGYSSATTTLNILFQTLPQVLLGRLIGFGAVGIYSRAVMLNQLPERVIINAFQPVLLPAFAAEARAGRDLKPAYLRGLALLTGVQWPSLVCLAVLAEPLVQVLLGSQWGDVVSPLKIMALASLILFPAPLTYPLLVSLGRVQDTLSASLISLPLSAFILVWVAPFGLDALAASAFLSGPLQIYVAIWFIQRRIPLRWSEIFAAIHKSAYVTACAALPAAIGLAMTSQMGAIAALAVAMTSAAGGWLIGLSLVNHPLGSEMLMLTKHAMSSAGNRLRNRQQPIR